MLGGVLVQGLGLGDPFEVGVLGTMGGGTLAGLSRAFFGLAGRPAAAAGGDPVQQYGLALVDLGKEVRRWRQVPERSPAAAGRPHRPGDRANRGDRLERFQPSADTRR
ncbi:hypothetical protein [Nonomuraea fuscirosea]|uniref:hypothetical protein n=1 Tax=Nonomuraea fuscirosea TaxID=1291556 RepID=UPI0033CC9D94